MSTLDNTGLGALIWETSRADEGTISAAGASIIAKAILSSEWLAAHDAEVRADERERVAEKVAAAAPAIGFELRYNGTVDPVAAAYVGGWHAAYETVRTAQ